MPHNKLFVRVNDALAPTHVSFATGEDVEELAFEWTSRLLSGPTIASEDRQLLDATDVCEYAQDAVSKRKLYQSRGCLVDSWDDLDRRIKSKADSEAAGLLVLRCQQSISNMVLGFAFFRRTWPNNITIDFLGAHPQNQFVGPPRPLLPVKGIGTALLVSLCRAASRIDAPRIWLEATSSSCHFYKHIFDLAEGTDLFTLDQVTYRKLL